MKSMQSKKIPFIVATVALVLSVFYFLSVYNNDETEEYRFQEIPKQSSSDILKETIVPEASIPNSSSLEKNSSATTEVFNLPELDDSDIFLRERVSLISKNRDLTLWLSSSDVIRRIVSYIDGLSRGVILDKIFPLSPPKNKLIIHMDDGKIWLNAGNYERYDQTIKVILSLDIKLLAKMFHFSRPLLETAFSELGYTPRQMDGIILRALDQILETPVIYEPIPLTRDSVTYKFEQPEIESLKPIQKQLIRSGPTNTEKIKNKAALLKKFLLNPNEK